MAARVHVLDLVTGTPRLGLWCNKHLLSCGFEADVYLLTDSGVGRVCTARGCVEDRN